MRAISREEPPEVKPCQMKMTRVALLRTRYRTAKMLLKPNSARFHAVVGLVSSEWHESQLHKNSSKPQSFVVSVCSFSDSLDSLC